MLSQMIQTLFKQSRVVKKLISLFLDGLFISVSFVLSFALRLDSFVTVTSLPHWLVLFCILPVTLIFFKQLGLYRSVLRYLSYQAALTISMGIVLSTLLMGFLAKLFGASMPNAVPIIYAALALLTCGGSRLMARALYLQSIKQFKAPVIIYGAGEAGRQLISSMQQSHKYRVVAFIDDDESLYSSVLHGVRVYPKAQIPELKKRFQVKKILVAMPSLSRARRREILEALQAFSLELLSMPGLEDLLSGKATINELKEVSIDDLLGRDIVTPFPELMDANIAKKVVMVTGAGGSIGSELCRQIIKQAPVALVLYELSEYALYAIEQELRQGCLKNALTTRLIPVLASVQDKQRLLSVMQGFKVQTVYHAAAYKHVPLVEYNVIEGLRNNVLGTQNAAFAAIEAEVETFVLISTDKAVRPTNVMGASKRFAELVLQALALEQNKTCFSMVRFGNVLGSSGSVVPLFKKQISEGGPVTLTHQDITRYFMATKEAAQLVIQAGAMGRGGDVFVLDMGYPVKISELAKKMIRLMGCTIKDSENPKGDIEIKVVGLRAGEKLHEELLVGGEEKPTTHPRILCAHEAHLSWQMLKRSLEDLTEACMARDLDKIQAVLLEVPLAFSPRESLQDLLWQENKQATAKRSVELVNG
jgi:FlaA1/EpsC-like NDP-sugar epimerase